MTRDRKRGDGREGKRRDEDSTNSRKQSDRSVIQL